MGLKNRRGSLDLDHDDDGSSHRDGRCRVHHDAELAMVGVRVNGMHVRHLDQGQQPQ